MPAPVLFRGKFCVIIANMFFSCFSLCQEVKKTSWHFFGGPESKMATKRHSKTLTFNPLDPMYRYIGIFVTSYIPKYRYIGMKLTLSGLNIM